MSPYKKLARAVIKQAFKDLNNFFEREGAIAFLTDNKNTMRGFWAEAAGLNPDAVRDEAKKRLGRA